MAVNRFSQFYQPQYSPEPLDALLQIGMMERGNIDKNLQTIQESAAYLGSLPALPGGDTNRRDEILKETEGKVKQIISSGKSLKDPMVGFQVNGLIHSVSKNRDLQNIVGAYYGYTSELQKDIQTAKKETKYSASHALPTQQYWYERMTDPNYHPGPEWQSQTSIERPTDYRKQINDLFSQVKDSGDIQRYPKGSPNAGQPVLNSNGEYIWLNSGKGVNADSLFKWGQNKGYLTQEGLRSLQLDGRYAYMGLTDEEKKKITPEEFGKGYFKNTVYDISRAYGHYVGDVQGFGAIPEHLLKAKESGTEEIFDQGKVTQTQDLLGLRFDKEGNVVNAGQGLFGQAGMMGEANPSVFGGGASGNMFEGVSSKPAYKSIDDLPPEKKALYKDLSHRVQQFNNIANDHWDSMPVNERNKLIQNYIDNYEQNGLLANATLLRYDVSTDKGQTLQTNKSNQYFEKETKNGVPVWTGRGLILNSKVYDDHHPQGISGTEYIKEEGTKNIVPQVYGHYTADNPTDATGGEFFQDKEGKTRYISSDPRRETDPIARYANKIYRAKYNPSGTNYFDMDRGHKFRSEYDEVTGLFSVSRLNDKYEPQQTWTTDYETFKTPEDLLTKIAQDQQQTK